MITFRPLTLLHLQLPFPLLTLLNRIVPAIRIHSVSPLIKPVRNHKNIILPQGRIGRCRLTKLLHPVFLLVIQRVSHNVWLS